MYYIKGNVEHLFEASLILDNNGIGYQIFLSNETLNSFTIGTDVKLYVYVHKKEDGDKIYGFLTLDELNMFNLLISVSGVGPKVGLAIVSSLNIDKIILSILSSDNISLSKAPGVGKKTAERIVLELRDKVKNISTQSSYNVNIESPKNINEKQDAIDALITLGYKKSDAMKAVLEVSLENMKTEEIIKLALKQLSSIF